MLMLTDSRGSEPTKKPRALPHFEQACGVFGRPVAPARTMALRAGRDNGTATSRLEYKPDLGRLESRNRAGGRLCLPGAVRTGRR